MKSFNYFKNIAIDGEGKFFGHMAESSGCVQFGYESEFTVPETLPLLAYYVPSAEFPCKDWSLLGAMERLGWIRTTLAEMRHGDKRAILVRNSDNEFPPSLDRDDTGNLELILPPENSLSSFLNRTKKIESIAVGSLQAMLSLPREAFFGSYRSPERAAKQHLGWLNFFNELDILERMDLGYERWSQSKKEPLRTFLHPYLGPMISLRHRLLRKFLRENALGNLLDKESLIRPGRRDQSFKYVGSTAYRPDIAAPDRFCFEIRDAHKSPELLHNRMARVLFYWTKNLTIFEKYSDVPAFDSAESYLIFPQAVRKSIEAITPLRIPPEVLAFETPKFTYEVYRNFSYPLRDWGPWLEIMGKKDELQKIEMAKETFLKEVIALSEREELTIERLQVLTVTFARDSGLYEIFREEEGNLIEAVSG